MAFVWRYCTVLKALFGPPPFYGVPVGKRLVIDRIPTALKEVHVTQRGG